MYNQSGRPRFNGHRNYRDNYRRNYRKNDSPANGEEGKKEVRYPGLPPYVQNVDAHIVRMIRILQSNADIRRYTSLGIIKRLISKKVLTEGGNYITFRWDKFTVCNKGINTDYRYTDEVFLRSFVAAFGILDDIASKALENFCKIEFDKSSVDAIPTPKDGKVDPIDTELINNQTEADENLGVFAQEQ